MPALSTLRLVALCALSVAFITATCLFVIERNKLENAEMELNQITEQRDSLISLINEQAEKIKSFNQLGVEYVAQLSAAKQEIDRLSERLRDGSERVLVKADCPAVPTTTSTRGVGDAIPPRLGSAAEQDYLRLKEMMAENLQQTKYLQDYIKEQCLN